MSPARVLLLEDCCANVEPTTLLLVSAATSTGVLVVVIAMSVALFEFNLFEAGYVDDFVFIHPSKSPLSPK